MLGKLKQLRNNRAERFVVLWPAVANAIRQKGIDSDPEQWYAAYLRECKRAAKWPNPIHSAIPLLSSVIALYPGMTVLAALSASVRATGHSVSAAYVVGYLAASLFFMADAWIHSILHSIRLWLFLGFITFLGIGSLLAIFTFGPLDGGSDLHSAETGLLDPDFRLGIVLDSGVVFFSVLASLLSLAVIRFLVYSIVRLSGASHLLIRHCMRLALRTHWDDDFARDVFDKRSYIRSLHLIAGEFRTSLPACMGLQDAESKAIEERLRGVARQVDGMIDWVVLAQQGTRAAMLDILSLTIGALITGRLHYLPFAEVPSKPASDAAEKAVPPWLQVLGLLPALILLGLGVTGVVLPAELRQWATSFGTVWLLLGASSILTGGTTSIVGTVREVLSTASADK